jgi:hypothetical protein
MEFQLTSKGETVIVTLDSDQPDLRSDLQFAGDAAAVHSIKQVLNVQHGLAGHLIGEVTCPADLLHAMRSQELRQFQPKLLSGSEALIGYQFHSNPNTAS